VSTRAAHRLCTRSRGAAEGANKQQKNCHPRESGDPAPAIVGDDVQALVHTCSLLRFWVPACAGMTALFLSSSAFPRLRVQMALAAVILGLVALVLPAHANTAFSNWAAVVVAGDHHAHDGTPSAIFDNARRGVVRDLEASGFAARNIAEFSVARHSGVAYARAGTIADTLKMLAQRSRGGCLLYISSHGSPDGVVLGDRWLTPRQLARIVDADCGSRPSVIVVSACFSGVFVPALAAGNRLVLTAARHDRSSFGCGQTDRYPYFDECVLSVWPHVDGFVALGRAARVCVATREMRERVGPPSEPQLRVGVAIAAALPKWR
jgi:peptidase C13-like protein